MITKEQFVAEINFIKELKEKEDKLCEVLEDMSGENCFAWIYGSPIAHITGLLKTMLNDSDWIEYYLWELDFGEKYTDGCVVDNEGNNIKLSTPEELYDFLMVNYNIGEQIEVIE